MDSARVREVPLVLELSLRFAKPFGLIKWLKASFSIGDINKDEEDSQGIND